MLARGIPLGVAQSVDNQATYYHALGEKGYAAQLGFFNHDKKWDFNFEIIDRLIVDFKYRKELVDCSSQVIDFKGASRILDAILEELSGLNSGSPRGP